MTSDLPGNRRRMRWPLIWGTFVALIIGVFFLGLFLIKGSAFKKFISPIPATKPKWEVFGFAPYWTLSKLDNVDWKTLTTFAYFSVLVEADGSLDKTSYEWKTFEGDKLKKLFAKAQENNVRRLVTFTQMDKGTIETFLEEPGAWEKLANESADILNSRKLDGVNIDFEYIPSNSHLRGQFSQFMETYSRILREKSDKPYITVSVLASSERFNRIYDISSLSKSTDAVFMMAYDFYTPGSEKVGPSAPLYGYNGGKGPFWYDVSTAVDDFLKVADSSKIIMGVPYYGWNYPSSSPTPNSMKLAGVKATATTNQKMMDNPILNITPFGGWNDDAKVSWRGYWDNLGWHVVYMEDEKSLSYKFDYAKSKNLKGVGIWALGFDANSDRFWNVLSSKFGNQYLSMGTQ